MRELTVLAVDENLFSVINFINEELEKNNCPVKTCTQIAIAVEEIFINIAHYAYRPNKGEVTIKCELASDPLAFYVIFIDSGAPYNPLKKPDPNITLAVDEREIGGLGIFMVKKSMDDVNYKYHEGENILTIKKLI